MDTHRVAGNGLNLPCGVIFVMRRLFAGLGLVQLTTNQSQNVSACRFKFSDVILNIVGFLLSQNALYMKGQEPS